MKTQNYINELKDCINNKLNEVIPSSYPDNLWDAMRYSVLGPGKRLRGILCIESCKTFNGTLEMALPIACAIETIHSQSLIHDDLPCMDNDDFRRGKLSTHKKYGEAEAVLAGDALIPLAYEIFLKYTPENVKNETKIKVVQEFSKIIGATGLVGGQFIDCENEGKTVSEETLKYIHSNKTGALYRFSLRSGAIIAECSENELALITEYADLLGLAFQISDDILDIIGSKENLGKTPGKDKATGKNTFPSIYGLDKSYKDLELLCNKAKEILLGNNINSEVLLDIAEYINNRVR